MTWTTDSRAIARLAIAVPCAVSASLLLLTSAHAVGGQAPAVGTTPLTRDVAESSAALVASEDHRLTQVGRLQGKQYQAPYRMSLGTGTGYTLVLTDRSSPYTIADLLELAPQTFVRLADGSYLLSEHIVVTSGATLRLAKPGGVTVRLASSSKGFVSMVSLGGKIELAGEAGAPVVLTSWDVDARKVDTNTADGRAYVRALGGQFEAQHVTASHLGFWSGRTGGIALTGTDGPDTGAIKPVGQAAKGVTTQAAGSLHEGRQNPNLNYPVPSQDYVSSSISDTHLDGNAFGLFVSGANGVHITDSTVRHSLIAGVVLHRYVTKGVISKTTSTDNVGDGFMLERATMGNTLREVTASHNTGSGISMSGRPLAEGPSPTGSTTSSFSGNSVSDSTANGNRRYGIQVLGGFNIGVRNNRVADNDMGVLVSGPAEHVVVTGNKVTRAARHGIALTGGVAASTVTGNAVDGAETGIYLRDSQGQVKRNTVQRATAHGVSLVGAVGGTDVGFNVLAGTGTSALDRGRSTGDITSAGNQLDGWHDANPWSHWFKKLLQPMTALWVMIAILILLSAVRSRGRKSIVVHPYAHQMAHQGLLAVPGHQVIDLAGRERPPVGTP